MALTIKTHEIQNILNMACLKATGFYLPDLGEDENVWKYKIVNGKKVGVLPKLNPRTILTHSVNNSIPQIICRSMIVDVFKQAKKYALQNQEIIKDYNNLVETESDWFDTYAHRCGDRSDKIKVYKVETTSNIDEQKIINLGFWLATANKYNIRIKYFIEKWYKYNNRETKFPTDYKKVRKTLRYDSDVMGEGIEDVVNSMNPMVDGYYEVEPIHSLQDGGDNYYGYKYITTGLIQDSFKSPAWNSCIGYADKSRKIWKNHKVEISQEKAKKFYTKKGTYRKRENGESYIINALVRNAIQFSNGGYDTSMSRIKEGRIKMIHHKNTKELFEDDSVKNCYYKWYGNSYKNPWWDTCRSFVSITDPWDEYIDFDKPSKAQVVDWFKNARLSGTKTYVADIEYREQMRIFGVSVEPNVESKLVKIYC